jgi:uncharacterized hydrophobic protein (TIGR00341 family)
MPFRLIDVVLPNEQRARVESIFERDTVVHVHYDAVADGLTEARALVRTPGTEDLTDLLDKQLAFSSDYRLIILRVEAILPRPPDEDSEEAHGPEAKPADGKRRTRVSREEILNAVRPATELNATFFVMVMLSSIVAAVGLYRSDVAVIIGAMVIAPLLGPNIALALATTLGDMKLGWRAARVGLSGLLAALVFSLVLGALLDPSGSEQVLARTRPTLADSPLALASGVAGALVFTSGASASLIGVMVAVALLPPLLTGGMLLGAGHGWDALAAFSLLLTNVTCVNLAGIATFLLQGVRPKNWWEMHRARRVARIAICFWLLLLVGLVFLNYQAPWR